MIYTQANWPRGHRLLDANGTEIKNAIWCNTETGECERLVPNTEPGNEHREVNLFFGCWSDYEPLPAPLRVEPMPMREVK